MIQCLPEVTLEQNTYFHELLSKVESVRSLEYVGEVESETVVWYGFKFGFEGDFYECRKGYVDMHSSGWTVTECGLYGEDDFSELPDTENTYELVCGSWNKGLPKLKEYFDNPELEDRESGPLKDHEKVACFLLLKTVL